MTLSLSFTQAALGVAIERARRAGLQVIRIQSDGTAVVDDQRDNSLSDKRFEDERDDLAWLLERRRVVDLTEDTAVIETATGTMSFRRHNKPALGPPGDSSHD